MEDSVGLFSSDKHSRALGVRKRQFKPSLAIILWEFQLGELVEVSVSMGPAPKKKGSPRKRIQAKATGGTKEKEGDVNKHITHKKKKKNEITMIKGEKAEQEILLHRVDSAASHI
ncbi:uncharacterized protein LOC133727433 [Rosa rugosa]|uniref:uncharacterized protein LOC133727433 n=1 Tax=Rosa rugosa TaxID=74645 RepID=UPI002B401E7B|nr:uncharacterized protein LOC133727433 [Rosa rugosa]